jgi:hypothetical protein
MAIKKMLIQEILARKALKEIGREAEIIIDHATPRTFIDGKEYKVVYPKYFLDYKANKDTEIMFSGRMTPRREEFLKKFPTAKIRSTTIAWDEKRKYDIDTEYFKELARTKFVISPNGDGINDKIGVYGDNEFAWSYRFFDAIFFRAIPIVEKPLKVYEGFKCYTVGDEYVYREDWVEYNLAKAKKELML